MGREKTILAGMREEEGKREKWRGTAPIIFHCSCWGGGVRRSCLSGCAEGGEKRKENLIAVLSMIALASLPNRREKKRKERAPIKPDRRKTKIKRPVRPKNEVGWLIYEGKEENGGETSVVKEDREKRKGDNAGHRPIRQLFSLLEFCRCR